MSLQAADMRYFCGFVVPVCFMLSDGEGLYLQVTHNGSRLWRLKFRFEGKEKLLAREDIAMGIDPSREKRLAKAKSKAEAEITFNLMAAEFCKKRKSDGKGGWSPATAKRSEYLLSLLHGNIGRMPITKIKPIEVLTAIREAIDNESGATLFGAPLGPFELTN